MPMKVMDYAQLEVTVIVQINVAESEELRTAAGAMATELHAQQNQKQILFLGRCRWAKSIFAFLV